MVINPINFDLHYNNEDSQNSGQHINCLAAFTITPF